MAPSDAQVAQLVEHATENRSVAGSIPALGTIIVNDLVYLPQGRFFRCGSFAGFSLQSATHHKQFRLAVVDVTNTIGGVTAGAILLRWSS